MRTHWAWRIAVASGVGAAAAAVPLARQLDRATIRRRFEELLERSAAARVELTHAGFAHEPDTRATDGEVDEVAARAADVGRARLRAACHADGHRRS